ncbi:hypothetical protein KR200_000622 [Drosophila serrata]|nr:hypothetical protein KR200_000622 [Drosophila serrata]
MEPQCCKCLDLPIADQIGNRTLDLSHSLGEFISFLVVLPLAFYAVVWHNSHLKAFFIVLACLLLCEFIIFFEPMEMKDRFAETAKLAFAGLIKVIGHLERFKDKIIEMHNNHLNTI